MHEQRSTRKFFWPPHTPLSPRAPNAQKEFCFLLPFNFSPLLYPLSLDCHTSQQEEEAKL
jgi:hypothetical protein